MSRIDSPFHLVMAGRTHIGRKSRNEDAFVIDSQLGIAAVADGVSRRPDGDVASQIAVKALLAHVTDPEATWPMELRARLALAIERTNRSVREQAREHEHLFGGMATTLACVMEHEGLLVVGHVGDSRVFRMRERELQRLTIDHRVLSDPLVRARVAPELITAVTTGHPNSLTRALGFRDQVVAETHVEALRANDMVLLATDGLWEIVDEETMANAMRSHRLPDAIVEALLRCAVERGAADNITCVCAYWRTTLSEGEARRR